MRFLSKITFRTILTLSMLFLFTGCSHQGHNEHMQSAQKRWNVVRARIKTQLAQQQYKSGHITDAIGTLEESISLDPDHIDAHVMLAQAFLELDRPRAAEHVIDSALNRIADEQKKEDEKENEPIQLEALTGELEPPRHQEEYPSLVYMQGVLAERSGDYDVAIERYLHAAELQPADPDMLRAAVECMVADGRAKDGFDLLRKEIKNCDADGSIYVLLADLALLLNEHEIAADAFQAALRTEAAEDQRVRIDYGICLKKLGRNHEAIVILEPIYNDLGNDAPSSLIATLADAYLATDRAGSARKLLSDYLRIHPDHEQNWRALGQIALAKSEWALASRCARETRRLNPDSSDPDLIEAVASWKLNDNQNAIKCLENGLKQHPSDALLHGLMGLVLQKTNPGKAFSHLDHAASLQPDCEWIRQARDSLATTQQNASPTKSKPEQSAPRITAAE